MNRTTMQEWAMYLFARKNPVLPPRRKAKTALRWIVAAKLAAEVDILGGPMTEWACNTLLDVSPNLVYPPTWPKCLPPDWKPGGVEDRVATMLAQFTLLRQLGWANAPAWWGIHDSAFLMREAWCMAYPLTWGTVNYPPLTPGNREDFLGYAQEAVSKEWELMWNTEYCHEWHGFLKAENLDNFLKMVDVARSNLAIRDQALGYARFGGTLFLYPDINEPPNLTVVFVPGQQPGPVPVELIEAVEYTLHIQ